MPRTRAAVLDASIWAKMASFSFFTRSCVALQQHNNTKAWTKTYNTSILKCFSPELVEQGTGFRRDGLQHKTSQNKSAHDRGKLAQYNVRMSQKPIQMQEYI